MKTEKAEKDTFNPLLSLRKRYDGYYLKNYLSFQSSSEFKIITGWNSTEISFFQSSSEFKLPASN